MPDKNKNQRQAAKLLFKLFLFLHSQLPDQKQEKKLKKGNFTSIKFRMTV